LLKTRMNDSNMTTAAQTRRTVRQRMTLAEFLTLPEGPPNFEFEKGEVIPTGSRTSLHQDTILELVHLLKRHATQTRTGSVYMGVDVFLPDEEHVYIPDITFLTTAHQDLHWPSDKKIHGTPDLVVEVTSTDPDRDRVEKFRVYFDNGVPWYWIIDPEHFAIEEYRATPEGYVRTASIMSGEEFRPRLFEGLVIKLSELIAQTTTK
jgi:Uma2 family endonuclease